jgi:fatty-acyl-CoA synthase
VSRFTDKMFHNAVTSSKGMVTGEPLEPVRHTWGEVHERARCIAGGLAAAGVGPGDAVGVLAGSPVEIAPTAQGLWMRGASITMLHQPTPRTDLVHWAEDTTNVIDMIEAKAVVISDPFLAAAPVLVERGVTVLTVAELLAAEPADPVETGEDDVALMQLTSGSTGSPKAVVITHRNIQSNAEAMFIGAEYDVEKDVMVSWLPCFHDMGMVGFLTIPMYFGAELVKVTPMDFLRDTLLWAKLIDKYHGTMTAAPNWATSTCPRCGSRCPGRNRWSRPTLRIYWMPVSHSVSPRVPSSRLTGWLKPPWRCRSPNAAPVWWSTRSTPTCWPHCAARCRRPKATPAGWQLSARCCATWRPASSTRTAPCCPPAAWASSNCAASR